MKDWVAYIGRVDGENHGWLDIFRFGDWLALDHPAGGKDQTAGDMRGMTLRQVMARYGDNAEMASRFDRLDEMLGRL